MEPLGFTLYLLFLLFLLVAPLWRGGDQATALRVLEFAAIGFLLAIAWRPPPLLALPPAVTIAIAVLVLYPLVQLIPLPAPVWQALPGHGEYAAVLKRFVEGGLSRPISVIPSATEYGWLSLLPPLACLLAALRLAPEHLASVLLWMVILAGLQAVLGIVQAGSGAESIFYLENKQAFGAAVGTLVNHSHLAGLLGMMLPVCVGLLVSSARGSERRRRRRASYATSAIAPASLLVVASAVIILACLLLTRSRVGVATGLIGLVSSMIVLVRARASARAVPSTSHSDFIVLALVTGMTAIAIMAGPIFERIEPAALRFGAQERLAVYWPTLRAAVEFLPFGSGLSTFAHVFPRFQAQGFVGYIDNADSVYLQSLLELGLAAIVIVGLLIGAYVARMVELLRRQYAHGFTLLQLSAGIGMLPMLLQSLFDDALHVPANAMWFATLAGVLFHQGVAPRAQLDTQDA